MAFLDTSGVERLWQHIVAKLGTKVDAESGKGLSTNDYTDAEKAKLAELDVDHTHDIEDVGNLKTELDGIRAEIDALESEVDSIDVAIPAAGANLGGVKTGGDVTIENGVITVNDGSHNHAISNISGLQAELDAKVDTSDLTSGDFVVAEATHAVSANTATSATSAGSATKATQDASGNVITATYETKKNAEATAASLTAAIGGKADASHTHDDRYYTEGEVDSKVDAINAAIANKADSSHTHTIASVTSLQTTLDAKVDASDFDSHLEDSNVHMTSAEKTKLAGIAAGAQVNTITGVKGSSETSYRTGNVNITAANIGLGNVNNTSDANKPVSTAQQAALDLKVPTSRTVNGKALTANITLSASDVGADASGSAADALTESKSYTDAEIAKLLDNPSETIDSIYELRDAMNDNEDAISALETIAAGKASSSDLTAHTGNTTVHVTAAERTNWNAAKTHADSTHAPSNAEKNQNAFSNVVVGDTTIAADTTTDSLLLVAGENVTLTPDATNDKITIAAKDTVYTHPNSGVTAGSYGDNADQTPAYGGTFKVPYVTVNAAGHVTGISAHTVKIPASDNTDEKVKSAAVSPSSSTAYYPTMVAGATTGAVSYFSPFKINALNGTASAAGSSEMVLGNSTASGTAGNVTGRISIYSSGTSYHKIEPTATNSIITHTLPAVTGTILNSGNYNTYAAAKSHTHTASQISDLTATVAELNYMDGVTSNVQAQLDGKYSAATSRTANTVLAAPNGSAGAATFRTLVAADIPNLDASKITSGTLGVARGGTGKATHTANAILTGNGTSAVNNVATASGAFYATAANGAPKFGTLPVAQGGTGATTAAVALQNLGLTATAAELNYVDGVTSNIQTQLNGKAASSHTHSYAGSASAGGSATSAVKLDGGAYVVVSSTQPTNANCQIWIKTA